MQNKSWKFPKVCHNLWIQDCLELSLNLSYEFFRHVLLLKLVNYLDCICVECFNYVFMCMRGGVGVGWVGVGVGLGLGWGLEILRGTKRKFRFNFCQQCRSHQTLLSEIAENRNIQKRNIVRKSNLVRSGVNLTELRSSIPEYIARSQTLLLLHVLFTVLCCMSVRSAIFYRRKSCR